MKLSQVLVEADCKLSPQVFRDLVKSIFVDNYPTKTDEDVYCCPGEAMIFCNKVKQTARAPQLADEHVLRTLTNIRKRGELPRLKDRAKASGGKPKRIHAALATVSKTRRASSKVLGTVATL